MFTGPSISSRPVRQDRPGPGLRVPVPVPDQALALALDLVQGPDPVRVHVRAPVLVQAVVRSGEAVLEAQVAPAGSSGAVAGPAAQAVLAGLSEVLAVRVGLPAAWERAVLAAQAVLAGLSEVLAVRVGLPAAWERAVLAAPLGAVDVPAARDGVERR